ncbi:hypothetical protein C3747_124g64 [Trypanosoma cruzi]|uniref:Uncharacterized protein n=2 Tax=Trypanosoma cruzi TaxID=5693 RepID=Q4DR63_TRYCC|nr:hypothetical protein, conserved [Trypanosoma cruzi]EAN95026.1 hypothetical protein, conserved [Trypanosoma cruzi]KAF8289388.1 hypothetical protein TcYC6_0024970 [Trypanosoma cruzi]PWV05803.1 hypothetical protein C3747_124g64 [Trypanosoma cruzi]RNC54974.1 hypothetical protein TcCL_ESM07577 [Trypanosoma cruzi]|eukprot:XP_816877.1 hypothetical protein [Trypanosoma cruzi strain CL Brener]
MRTFETFLLEAANRAPFLVGEAAPVLVRRQQKRAREGDKETDEGETRQLPQEEDIVRLQRLLVDGPLQPLGLEHAVYHFLLPAFTAAMDAAREVWRTTEALRAAEKATKAKEGDGAMKKESEESAGANSDPIGTTTGAETSTQPQPNVEALQRALVAAQATLNAQRQLLDAAEAKLRTIVEAVMCAFAKPKISPRDEET